MSRLTVLKGIYVGILSCVLFGYGVPANAELVINPYPLKSQSTETRAAPTIPAMPKASTPEISLKMEAPVDITAPPGDVLLPSPSDASMPSMPPQAGLQVPAPAYVDYGAHVSQIEPAAGAGIPPAQPRKSDLLGSIDKYNLVAIGAQPAAQRRSVSSSRSYGITSPENPLWYAAHGADLQETLRHWSERAGVRVVWDAYGRFSVPGKFEFGGRYEEAIGALLQGYSGQTRPVANLYVDPHTGTQTLVVQVSSS